MPASSRLCAICLSAAALFAVSATLAHASDFSISKVLPATTDAGTQAINVSLVVTPSLAVDMQEVRVMVYFYKKTTSGDVLLTEKPVISRWISPPIDWAGGQSETLQMTVPVEDPASGDVPEGFVIGIYYQKKLQDTWAEPAHLLKDFPLPNELEFK